MFIHCNIFYIILCSYFDAFSSDFKLEQWTFLRNNSNKAKADNITIYKKIIKSKQDYV